MYILSNTYTPMLTLSHSLTLTLILSHSCKHIHTLSFSRSLSHAHSLSNSLCQSLQHIHRHSHSHSHTLTLFYGLSSLREWLLFFFVWRMSCKYVSSMCNTELIQWHFEGKIQNIKCPFIVLYPIIIKFKMKINWFSFKLN